MSTMRSLLKLAAKLCLLGVVALLLPMFVVWVLAANEDIVAAEDTIDLPGGPVDAVIVPGARVFSSGRPSGALLDRILIAEAIVVSGQSNLVFASGAPGEPEVIAENLPGIEVVLDLEGLSTSDTCRNAAEAGFGRVAIATQLRHKNRTAVLCEAFGLDPVVVTAAAATNERLSRAPWRFVRERLAEGWALVIVTRELF